MSVGPELLLVGAIAGVGVLHTIVPDHWVPITLIARQRGWTRAETARAALQAGTGHVLSTLAIAVVVWWAGAAVAQRFGHVVDTTASLALIAFGGWIALSAWRDLRTSGHHGGHGHRHIFPHLHAHDHDAEHDPIHGPERQRIATGAGDVELSIFETGIPPHFRLTGPELDTVSVETVRDDGARQRFAFATRGPFWESLVQIPEPHEFAVTVTVDWGGDVQSFATQFTEHDHGHDHHHDHGDLNHGASQKTSTRTALLLILGSSPMVEGIPAFFAAGKYGIGLIVTMAIVFAISTTATYVLLCVYSTAGLQRVRLGAFERYGEVLSGAFIALVGLAFWIWPVL